MDENNKEQEMLEGDLIKTTQEYLEASAQLADATALCGDDPIKQEMISFITDDFLKMCARSEGIRIMAEKSYTDNREFIIAEMKGVTILNLKMAEEIRDKLSSLK